jgi:predicted transcriptional regulator YdeE
MKLNILDVNAFTAVGMKYRGKNANNEIPKWWDVFIPRAGEIKHRTAIAYGIMGNYDPATGEFDYLAAFGVERVEDIPQGMERWDVPGGKYAAFPCTLATLHETFNSINNGNWQAETGTQRDMRLEFELYPAEFEGGDSEMFIYIPVK